MKPGIRTPKEIESMRKGGQILAETLDFVCSMAKPGVSTFELDKMAEEFIRSRKAKPAFKGFHGFPATLCTCVNNVIVHGIPRQNEILKEGDLLKIDCGVIYDNLYTDSARAIAIGKISDEKKRLIDTAKLALKRAISIVKAGTKTSKIGKIIEDTVEKEGFKIIYDLTGHGVGKTLHEPPVVFNYYNKKEDATLKAGMTIAIEPIFSVSTHKMQTERDKWTITTVDGSDSVQVEHTILVKENGAEILTPSKLAD
ncbi:MAG: type I methionyl aminopeptidase [Candidatus Gracilibacteria bacterium]|jgi:methionyl aminopeptidase|nr:type I methionyl aminopeptidase [Candidatus Gracilibacteria bacterium]